MLEMLMLAASPLQILTGKLIGLGLVGLLQTGVWVVLGRLLVLQSDQVFTLPEALRLPPSFVFWGIVFFVLGYLLYGSLLAGLGALVPNLREASQASFIVTLPLFIPFLLVGVLIEKPDSTLALVLSIFPFSAPVAMMTRLAATHPPTWQPAAASLLILISIMLVIRSVARLFRAQVLMTGQPFKLSLYFKALFNI
jgi:ABC-2 type transport system permease protein